MNISISPWWYALSTNGAFVISVIFGFFVYRKNKASSVNKWFALVCFAVGLFCFDSFLIAYLPSNFDLFFGRLLYFCPIFTSVCFIYWVYAITGTKNKISSMYSKITNFGAIILTVLSFTPLLIKEINTSHYGTIKFIIPGPVYPLFIWFMFLNGIIGLYTFIKNIKLTYGSKKTQLIYVTVASVAMYLGAFLYFLFVYKIGRVPPIGDFFSIVSNSIITYAIVRHQLMEIEVIIKRTLVFAGLFAFVYAVFAGMAYLTQLTFQNIIGLNRWIAMIPSVLIVIFTLRPLERFLVNTTDRFLFQKKYDYKELLKTFTGEVLTVLDLSKLVNVTTENLSKIIRLESCAVLIHDKDKDNYPISASLGLKEPSQVFAKTTHLINYLLKTQHYLLKNKTITDLPDIGTVKEDLKKLNAELVIPIVLHDDLMGALTLGRKKSGEDFTQDDLDILLPLSQTLAVAISNAQYLTELIKSESQNEKMKAIATLAAGMAHEIKNPLTAIKTYAAFMPKYWQDKNFIDKFNRVVPESVNRIDRIVKDLLAFSRPTPPEFKEVKISDIASHTLDYVSNDLVRNGINYSFDFKDNGAIIQADQNQLTQVFLNLFLNAIDAMPQGGMLTISTQIINSAISDNSRSNIVQIRINDTGCGISGDNLKHIFDPFFTTKDTGTGLGLSIVQEIVSNHQGAIRAESEAGKGTTFILEFPLIDTAKT